MQENGCWTTNLASKQLFDHAGLTRPPSPQPTKKQPYGLILTSMVLAAIALLVLPMSERNSLVPLEPLGILKIFIILGILALGVIAQFVAYLASGRK